MPQRFAEIAFGEHAKALQEKHGSRLAYARREAPHTGREEIDDDVRDFVAQRDSFYLATITEDGWPYIQHRGGPRGFLRFVGPRTLAFADYRGNKQYVSIGNLETNDKVSLFLMDYPNQTRLKFFARARSVERSDDPALIDALADPAYPAKIERAIVFEIEGFDWNCPQHITPRWSLDELRAEGILPAN